MLKVIFIAASIYAGPYEAQVVEVIDGDNVKVEAAAWPGVEMHVSVRIRGIDAPETWRPKCERERALGEAATEFVTAWVGETVVLRNVSEGKFAGRVIADVWKDGENLGDVLVREGHARAYDGGKRPNWCEPSP